MKKLLSFMVTIAIIATIALLPAEGYSGPRWRLYDNFSDETIDLDRWIIDPEGAPITIEEGEAKFEIAPGPPDQPPNFLIINMKPEKLQKIKGIRVTVRVEAENEGYVSDIMGGIGAMIGKWPLLEDHYVWDYLYIQAGSRTISCGLPVFVFPGPFIPFHIFYGEFGEFPFGFLLNTNITITMIFSENEMTYEGSVGGTIIRQLARNLDPSDYRHFRGLVTWSYSGEGTANVYFDDVYILK